MVVVKALLDKYITTDMQEADPVAAKDKVVVSNDTYAKCDIMICMCERMDRLCIAMRKGSMR